VRVRSRASLPGERHLRPGAGGQTLLGAGASVVLEGQRVLPKRAADAGFRFQFSQVGPALASIFRRASASWGCLGWAWRRARAVAGCCGGGGWAPSGQPGAQGMRRRGQS